jgi:hypothetical protein
MLSLLCLITAVIKIKIFKKNSVFWGEIQPTFRRNISPPSSEPKIKPSKDSA